MGINTVFFAREYWRENQANRDRVGAKDSVQKKGERILNGSGVGRVFLFVVYKFIGVRKGHLGVGGPCLYLDFR